MEAPSHRDKQLSSCANWSCPPLLHGFDSDTVEDDFASADVDVEIAERLGGPKRSELTTVQQMSTIMVNLRVSCELLQQASSSLDVVEKHFRSDHRLEAVAGPSDAPPSICPDSSCASSFTSLSTPSTKVSAVSLAVGPGLKLYSPLKYRGDYWTKNLEAQFLTGDWELLSKEELALWMSRFPAEEQQQREPSSTYHSAEDLSQYRSAVEDFLSSLLCDETQQQTSRSEENADGTVEVFRPTATEIIHLDALNTEYGLDNNPGVSGAEAPYR